MTLCISLQLFTLSHVQDAAVSACNSEMIYQQEHDNLLNKAACLNVLAYRSKSIETSAYDLAFEIEVLIIDRDLIRFKTYLVMSSILTMY